jgi:hypothetical protein
MLIVPKSSRCEFVSKAWRLFNSQRSGRFVVAQQCAHPTLAAAPRPHLHLVPVQVWW